jgi:ABC-2 type transport system ATP-binding protein
MEQNTTVLSIKHVSKHLGKRKILSDITLDVKEGEIFGFLGPNGSGKTTTIKLILGLLRMESGEISICDHDNVKEFEDAMRCVGGIIENPEMYKYLTGRQNLEQYARMYPDLPRERVDEVIRLVRMESRIDDKIAKYSLGMRQRLGIAQAVLHNPAC